MASLKGSLLITGANGGLGSAMVSQIVTSSIGKEHYGIYTVRNPASPGALGPALRKGTGHKHEVVALDLSSLANTRIAAETINKRVTEGSIPRIKVLIISAAYQDAFTLTKTTDGFETSFQVNHLAQFLFTLLLLQSMDKEHGRILFVGSWSHDPKNIRNDFGNVKGSMTMLQDGLLVDLEGTARGTWSTPEEDPSYNAGYRRYGVSKLCEMIFMNELAARLGSDPALQNISVVGCDPGGMPTGLVRRNNWLMRNTMAYLGPSMIATYQHFKPNDLLRTPARSAQDVLRLGFEMDVASERPKVVYMDGCNRSDTSDEAKDAGKRTLVWRESVKWAGLKEGDTVLQRWQ